MAESAKDTTIPIWFQLLPNKTRACQIKKKSFDIDYIPKLHVCFNDKKVVDTNINTKSLIPLQLYASSQGFSSDWITSKHFRFMRKMIHKRFTVLSSIIYLMVQYLIANNIVFEIPLFLAPQKNHAIPTLYSKQVCPIFKNWQCLLLRNSAI